MTNQHQVVQNNNLTINLLNQTKFRGYTLSGVFFTHIKGYDDRELIVKSFTVVQGKTYTINFTVGGTDSTTNLKYYVGGTESTEITTTAYIQETVVAENNGYITFKGSGNFTISDLSILPQNTEVTSTSEDTITFSQERSKWVSFKSIISDCGFSIYTNLYTFKNGHLFKHTNEATPNNFYGKQFHSLIKFYVSSVGVKTYGSLAIHGNKNLSTTEDGISTQLGQVSDLFLEDFQTREGVQAGVFYRDKSTGLIDGDILKGRWISVELTDEASATEDLKLQRVVVKSNISSPNE